VVREERATLGYPGAQRPVESARAAVLTGLATGLQTCEVENIVDESGHALGRNDDAVQEVPLRVRIPFHVGLE
jgi:hypothetical protein